MSGFCVLNRFFQASAFVLILSWGMGVALAAGKSQKGTVLSEEAFVYQNADFDAPVIASVHRGENYDISIGRKGPFYKIRLKPGSLGWIADNDIVPGANRVPERKVNPNAPKMKKKKAPAAQTPKKKSKPFVIEDYRGPALEYLPFREETLGGDRKENLLFYGFKWAGPNLIVDGDTVTDATVLFHYGAPRYYKDATGNDASGWIVLANFLLQSNQSQGRDVMTFYGFGPAFRYSHFNVALKASGQNTNYAADDMTLGAVFDAGIALRRDNYALRADAKYYWEKNTYLGFGVAFLWKF